MHIKIHEDEVKVLALIDSGENLCFLKRKYVDPHYWEPCRTPVRGFGGRKAIEYKTSFGKVCLGNFYINCIFLLVEDDFTRECIIGTSLLSTTIPHGVKYNSRGQIGYHFTVKRK